MIRIIRYTIAALLILAFTGCGEDTATSINLERRHFAIETSNPTPACMESVRLGLTAIDAEGNRTDAAQLDDIVRVEWDFGDGTRQTADAGSAFRHQYAAEGNYTITVRVTLASGQTRTDTSFVEVAGRSIRYEMEHHDGKTVWIMAHRGRYDDQAEHGIPENTVDAYLHCIELGCVDIIETDVRTTKDRRLVVCHDNTTVKAANGGGDIKHMTLKQIQTFKLYDRLGNVTSYTFNTLEEVLLACRGKVWLKIDKIVDNDIELVYEAVRKCGMLDQVLFYFSQAQNSDDDSDLVNNGLECIEKLNRHTPEAVLHPHSNTLGRFDTYDGKPNVHSFEVSTAYAMQPGNEVVRAMREKGYIVMTNLLDYDYWFTQGDTSVPDTFLENDCNVIQTDVCMTLDRYLKEKGRR